MSIYKIAIIDFMIKKGGKMRFKDFINRNKKKDDDFFNCSEPWELDYVASLYKPYDFMVLNWLKKQCVSGRLFYKKHYEVYALIEKELGLKRNL